MSKTDKAELALLRTLAKIVGGLSAIEIHDPETFNSSPMVVISADRYARLTEAWSEWAAAFGPGSGGDSIIENRREKT